MTEKEYEDKQVLLFMRELGECVDHHAGDAMTDQIKIRSNLMLAYLVDSLRDAVKKNKGAQFDAAVQRAKTGGLFLV